MTTHVYEHRDNVVPRQAAATAPGSTSKALVTPLLEAPHPEAWPVPERWER
jgi:hypothetical protein